MQKKPQSLLLFFKYEKIARKSYIRTKVDIFWTFLFKRSKKSEWTLQVIETKHGNPVSYAY